MPTIRALAPHSAATSPAHDVTTLPIPRADRQSPLRLSFSQERLWFLEQLGSGAGHYNIFQGTRITGALNVEALEQALQTVLWRHEILRTRYVGSTARQSRSLIRRSPSPCPATT